MTWPAPTPTSDVIRAADDDREVALDLLREHWLAGRLTLAEYEARCDEVGRARFIGDLERAVRELPLTSPASAPVLVQPGNGAAIASCVLGITSLAALLLTFGVLFFLTLPLSIAAWALGRRGRRHATPASRSLCIVGEVTGLMGTVVALLALSACAMLVSIV
jgi:hypothetical protein